MLFTQIYCEPGFQQEICSVVHFSIPVTVNEYIIIPPLGSCFVQHMHCVYCSPQLHNINEVATNIYIYIYIQLYNFPQKVDGDGDGSWWHKRSSLQSPSPQCSPLQCPSPQCPSLESPSPQCPSPKYPSLQCPSPIAHCSRSLVSHSLFLFISHSLVVSLSRCLSFSHSLTQDSCNTLSSQLILTGPEHNLRHVFRVCLCPVEKNTLSILRNKWTTTF